MKHGSSNSPNRVSSRLPQPQRWGKGPKLLALVAAALLLGGGGYGYFLFAGSTADRDDLVTYTVGREPLQVTIVERGTLESAENNDIICQVKAKSQGSTISTSIKWVIEDGSHVKKGQKLVELDDSGLQEQLKLQRITVDAAYAAYVNAREQLSITESQNESDIATAKTTLELARIALDKYVKGEYPQLLKDVDGRLENARADLEMWEDRAAWSQRMLQRGYITATQAQADQSRLKSAEFALAKIQEERRVLVEYTKKQMETDLRSKVEEAERALKRVESQAEGKLAIAQSELKSKESIYKQELSRLKEIEEEIKKCVLYAPEDGLVVYYMSEQSFFGGGSQQSIVAQGEPVREGQKLMRIPNLSKMVVNTRVHEAMVSRVRGESGSYPGQYAEIRVDAYPEVILKGHVKSVAAVASQLERWSSDVKVYQTIVAIDEQLPGLKPGMSAEVAIFTEAKADNVLTIPLQAVVSTTDMGKYRKCFVMLPDGSTEPRQIVVGLTNDTKAEIKEGLKEGEQVVLNPRALLTDEERASLIAPEKTAGASRGSPGAEGGPPGNDGGPGARGAGGPGVGGPGGAFPDRGEGPGGPERPGGGPPGAGPEMKKGPRGAGPGGRGNSPEMQQRWQRLQSATPQERKKLVDEMPAEIREKVRQGLKSRGLEIAD